MYLLTFKLYTYGSSQVILRVNSLYVSSKFVFQSQSQNRTKEALASVEMVARASPSAISHLLIWNNVYKQNEKAEPRERSGKNEEEEEAVGNASK